MIKRILVTLDGSDLSEAVVPYALTLAGGLGADVTLLHAIDLSLEDLLGDGGDDVPDLENIRRSYAESAREYLSHWTARLADQPVSVATLAVPGKAAEAILDYAEEHQPDLIAMSTRGRSGLGRFLLGSVTGRVLSQATGPVLVLHPQDTGSVDLTASLTELVVPLDGSALAEAALPLARELGQALDLNLHLVMAVPTALQLVLGSDLVVYPGNVLQATRETARLYLQGISRELEEDGLRVEWRILPGEPGDAIVEYSTSLENNLVVMSSHGRSGFRRWALGSVADQVARSSHDPVIVVRAADSAG